MIKRLGVLKTATAGITCLMLVLPQSFLVPRGNSYQLLQALLIDGFIILGIYTFRGFQWGNRTSLNSLFSSIFIGSLFGSLLSLIPIYLFPQRVSFLLLLFSFLLSAAGAPFLFFAALQLFIKYFPDRNYLVIGKKEKIEAILEEVQKASFDKVKVYRYMNPSSVALQQELDNAIAFDGILIADQELASHVEPVLNKAHERRIPVNYLPILVEDTLQRIPIALIEIFKEYYEIAFSKANYSPAKRIYDVILAVVALTFTSPLLAVFSLLIFLESGLPIIFKQKRTGKELVPFTMYKFRSLTNISKNKLDKMENPNQTIEQRVTKVGKVLRLMRLDEIPQFWNVLKGNMSVIGPRPEMDAYHEMGMRQIPFYRFRYNLKPGITGWAQIHYKHTSSLDDYYVKTEHDLYYIKNRTILLDIQITLHTIETMLGLRGSK